MLTEDEVVHAVIAYLEQADWSIESVALAHQRGNDIVAIRDGERLLVEAKGEGSSKPQTRRFGEAFTANQVRSHVAVAVLRALAWASLDAVRPSLALPDNEDHRNRIEPVASSLTRLGIGIFWISAEASVRLEAPWQL